MTDDEAWDNYQAILRAAGAKCYRCGMPVEWHAPSAEHPEWCIINHPPLDATADREIASHD